MPVLEKVGVPVQQLLHGVNQAIDKLPKVAGGGAQPGLSSALQKVLDQAFKEAENFKDEYCLYGAPAAGADRAKSDPVQSMLTALGANACGDSEGAAARCAGRSG